MKNHKKICQDARLLAHLHASSGIYVYLITVLGLIAASAVQGQGHGLCNNSGGFRQFRQIASENPELIEEAPELLAHIERDEDLSDIEKEVFKKIYKNLCLRNANKLDTLTYYERISESQLSSPALYTRNNALAFDLTVGLDKPIESSLGISRTPLDTGTNLRVVALDGQYPADYKTFFDLSKIDAPKLRFNESELSETIQTFIRENNFNQYDLIELQKFLTSSLPADEIAAFPQPRTLTQTYSTLSKMEVGDSAIVNYNAQFIVPEDVQLTNRYSLYIQRISEEKFVLFDPLSARLNSYGNAVSLFNKTEGPQAFRDILFNNQSYLYRYIVSDIKDAIEGMFPLEYGLNIRIMKNEYGASTLEDLSDILFADFNIITHGPPPVP